VDGVEVAVHLKARPGLLAAKAGHHSRGRGMSAGGPLDDEAIILEHAGEEAESLARLPSTAGDGHEGTSRPLQAAGVEG
jgi:hypothetical protein